MYMNNCCSLEVDIVLFSQVSIIPLIKVFTPLTVILKEDRFLDVYI